MPPQVHIDGQKFGFLTAICATTKRTEQGSILWHCTCICEKVVYLTSSRLKDGYIQSCGCRKFIDLDKWAKDEKGKKYGYLTVLERAEKNKLGVVYWTCRCECNNLTQVPGSMLRRGKTTSCGCRRGSRFEDRSRSAANAIIGRYKQGARKRNLTWELSDDECLDFFKKSCFYCGIEASNVSNIARLKRGRSFQYSGLDRVDNSKGYFTENVVACCHVCNWAKMDMTLSDFRQWVACVHAHLLTKVL